MINKGQTYEETENRDANTVATHPEEEETALVLGGGKAAKEHKTNPALDVDVFPVSVTVLDLETILFTLH